MFVQPIALGVDVVVASMSKYVSGHSDCMMGMIASTEQYHDTIRQTVFGLGDKIGAQEVFLALHGLRTLNMRMKHVNVAGREMAQWLGTQPQTKTVLHPAFESCLGNENWKRDFTGASGLFSVVFHPCPDENVRAFVDALHHFGIGVSWSGFESLVLPFVTQRTVGTWAEDGQLVRFNIGFEDLDSLKADLAAALPLLNFEPEQS